MQQLKAKDLEEEKEMYFQTLNSIDEYLTSGLNLPDINESLTVKQVLEQVQEIMLNNAGASERLSSPDGKNKRMINAGTIDVQMDE